MIWVFSCNAIDSNHESKKTPNLSSHFAFCLSGLMWALDSCSSHWNVVAKLRNWLVATRVTKLTIP